MAIALSDIKLVHNSHIDKDVWNQKVISYNGSIYCHTDVLDTLCDGWDALILGDYRYFLALPFKHKYGHKIYANPAFLQTIFIIGNNTSKEIESLFFDKIVHIVRIGVLRINVIPEDLTLIDNILCKKRTNYILPLKYSYTDLYDNYSTECKKNIRKSIHRGCQLLKNIFNYTDVIQYYKKAYGDKTSYTPKDYNRIASLFQIAHIRQWIDIYTVTDKAGTPVFHAVILTFGKRKYYILGAPNKEGRQLRATYFFINTIIQTYANSEYILDFEGSDIDTVAHFYRSFGPQTEIHTQLIKTECLFPLNYYLKKKWLH